MASKPPQTSEQSNNRAGSWQNPQAPKEADKALRYIVDLYNKTNPGQPIDPSLSAVIMVILRLHDSLKKDTEFRGGYNEMAKVIRRQLYNHLNVSVLYRE